MPYQWLKVDGEQSDAPEGGKALAVLDLASREVTFREDTILNSSPGKFLSLGSGLRAGVVAVERTFTEEGAGTYTGAVVLPAGAILLDVLVHCTALWDAATSASMEVGDTADPDGIFTAIDVKSTDLIATESINLYAAGGQHGADVADVATPGSHIKRRYLGAARTITGTIVSVGAGTAGRTRMVVVYVLPETAAATFVAA